MYNSSKSKMNARVPSDLQFLFDEYFAMSEELYRKSVDCEWAALQLDALTDDTVANWNLDTLLHIVAFNRSMASRAVLLLRKYVDHYSTE